MKWGCVFSVVFCVSQTALAAGGGSGSIADLKWPAVNFILLASFLAFKLKRPLRENFDKNAEEVTFLAEQAESKDRQAQIRLDTYKKKMADINSERQKITKAADEETRRYAKRAERATGEYLDRLVRDLKRKMAQEKQALGDEINACLMDEVIKRAKGMVAGDQALKQKVARKLVSHMGQAR